MTTHDEKMNDRKKICIEELRAIKVLGRGAMGCVLLVVRNGCHDNPFALKVIRKSTKDQQWLTKLRRIHREREILSSLHYPFLPFLMAEVETEFMVGWASEYCPGGDLHHLRQIQSDRSFSESAIRFYAAEIVLALEHLHSQGIVYRDLKPENILVQSSGHIMLTDFDLSKRLVLNSNESHISHNQQQQKKHSIQERGGWPVLRRMLSSKAKKPCPSTQVTPALNQSLQKSFCRTNSFVGTDEYVAPEIINGEGHEFSVDWWSLGILLYELLYGTTPFKGSNKKETFTRILLMTPKLMGPSTPLHDLILRLLQKNPQKRLGFSNGADEIKRHLFFTGLQWGSVHDVCRPPFVPNVDTSYHYCTDHLLTSEMESILHAINIVSVSESEEDQTTDSEVDGLF